MPLRTLVLAALVGSLAACGPSLQETRYSIWRKGTLFKGPPASVATLASKGRAHRALVLDALMECLLITRPGGWERKLYEIDLQRPGVGPVFPSNISGVAEPCVGPHSAAVRAARDSRDFYADTAASQLEREDLEERIVATLKATQAMRGAPHAQLPLAILALPPKLLEQAFEAGALVIPPPEPVAFEPGSVVTADQVIASEWARIKVALGQIRTEDQVFAGNLRELGRAQVAVMYGHGYPVSSKHDLLIIVDGNYGQTAVDLLVPRLAGWVAARPAEASGTVTELLQRAVPRGDTAVVEALLDQPVKADLTLDWVADMPTHPDAKFANRAMAELLVAHGARTRVTCVRGGHLPIFDYMVALGNQAGSCGDGRSTLAEAIKQGRKDLIARLLAQGADAGSPGALAAAVQNRELEVLRLLLDRGAGIEQGLLTVALHGGSIESAELLLDRGARPDAALLTGLIASLAVLHDPEIDGNDAFRMVHASLLDESRHPPWPYHDAAQLVGLARGENCAGHCLDRVGLEALTVRVVAAAAIDALDTRIPGTRRESLLALAARGNLDRVVAALVAAKADVNAKNAFEALPLDEATPSAARILRSKRARHGDPAAIRANYEARASAHAAELAADRARRDRRVQRREDAEAEEQATLARERAEREALDAAAERAMRDAQPVGGQASGPGATSGGGGASGRGSFVIHTQRIGTIKPAPAPPPASPPSPPPSPPPPAPPPSSPPTPCSGGCGSPR